MPDTRANIKFRETVIAHLTEVKTSQEAIVQRLDKINGSVARHEESITQLKIDAGSRKEAELTNARWMKASWGLVGALLIFALEHIGSIVATFVK